MNRTDEQKFMKERPVLPLVLMMSLPMVLSMAVNALYNIVDSFFVAKISGEAMTAVSLILPLQNLISAAAIGYGVGGCSAISYYLGAGDRKKTDEAATIGYIMAFLHGIALGILCILLLKPFLRSFTNSEETIRYGMDYAAVIFLFSPALMLGMHAEKVLQAAGRMTDTMLCMLAGCIFNIIMDPVLIFGIGPFPEMGIRGAALATGLGELIAFLLYAGAGIIKPLPISYRFREYIKLSVLTEGIKNKESVFRRIYSVGIPAALNLALPSVTVSALNAILSGLSQSYVLILGVYYKLQTLLYLPANGIIQGIRPIVGYNYGAGEYDRVRKTGTVTFSLCCAIMAAGTLLCLFIPDRLIGLFTDNTSIVRDGALAFRIISARFIISSVSVTISGIMEGIGKGRSSLIISVCRYTAVMIPAAFILSRFMGANGVWCAFGVTELIVAVIAFRLKPF